MPQVGSGACWEISQRGTVKPLANSEGAVQGIMGCSSRSGVAKMESR